LQRDGLPVPARGVQDLVLDPEASALPRLEERHCVRFEPRGLLRVRRKGHDLDRRAVRLPEDEDDVAPATIGLGCGQGRALAVMQV